MGPGVPAYACAPRELVPENGPHPPGRYAKAVEDCSHAAKPFLEEVGPGVPAYACAPLEVVPEKGAHPQGRYGLRLRPCLAQTRVAQGHRATVRVNENSLSWTMLRPVSKLAVLDLSEAVLDGFGDVDLHQYIMTQMNSLLG